MLKEQKNLPSIITSIIIGFCIITVMTICYNYPGKIQIKFGVEGASLQIEGSKK